MRGLQYINDVEKSGKADSAGNNFVPPVSEHEESDTDTESSDSRWLRAYSGRGVLRDQNRFLKGSCFFLLAILLATNYLWFRHSLVLGEKQWIVVKVNGLETTVHPASEFQTGPTDEEIRGRSWDVVRWMLAVNSKTIDKSYEEAKRLMTLELQADFETHFGPAWRQKIKNDGIYFKISNVDIHQMSAKDLPAGSKYKPSRFEVIVNGNLEAYDETTNKFNKSEPFTYYLRVVPLQNRSVEYPSGLLISELREFEIKNTNKKQVPEAGQSDK